jgi:hypothetical protein
MKKLIVSAVLLLSVCFSVFSQDDADSTAQSSFWLTNDMAKKSIYILPGEYYADWFRIYNGKTPYVGSYDEGKFILSFEAKISKQISFNSFFSDCSREIPNEWGYLCDSVNTDFDTYTKIASNSGNRSPGYPIFFLNGIRKQQPDSLVVKLMATVLSDSLREYMIMRTFCFLAIDGIRGDVDGNGIVNRNDVAAYIHGKNQIEAIVRSVAEFRFTNSGANLGKLILPGHSMPTNLVGPTLLNIWLSDSNDLVTKNLGFGRLMSENAYKSELAKKSVTAMRYTSEIAGNKLIIKTSPNVAINVFIFIDGKLWQKDNFADASGQWVVEIPDPTAKYTVEICELGGSISPTAVYQKPAIKNINSLQKFSGQSTVYGIDGRRIANANHAFGLSIVRQPNGKITKTFQIKH